MVYITVSYSNIRNAFANSFSLPNLTFGWSLRTGRSRLLFVLVGQSVNVYGGSLSLCYVLGLTRKIKGRPLRHLSSRLDMEKKHTEQRPSYVTGHLLINLWSPSPPEM